MLGEKLPERCLGLFQHVDIVLETNCNFGGFTWFNYDEGFRQKLSVYPSLKWGVKDVGLWMNLIVPLKPAARANMTSTGLRKGTCYAFNKSRCKWPHSCKYKHEYSFCSRSRSMSRCFKKANLPSQPSTKDYLSKSTRMRPWLDHYPNR